MLALTRVGVALLVGYVAGCTPSAVVATLLPDKEKKVDHPSELRSSGATELDVGTPSRPAVVALPAVRERAPLVVLLHGYGMPSKYFDEYLGLRELTRKRGMYLLLPESLSDSSGLPYWSATDACCDFDHSQPDDVAALSDAIERTAKVLPVDRSRIYLVGDSNGGFMAYRMACERSELIAGIVVLAGADYLVPEQCAPAKPVSVLHLHGDSDSIVSYTGGTVPSLLGELKPFPSARQSVAHWAARGRCEPVPVSGPELDLTTDEVGDNSKETVVSNFAGCAPGVSVALWTIRGSGHEPAFHDGAFGAAIDWIVKQRR